MLKKARQKIEHSLYARGFSAPVVRHLLCTQLLLAAFGLGFGAVTFWLTLWPLMFGIGAAIAAYNFWHIARFGQAHIASEFSLGLGLKLFTGFTIRLVLTGVVLFMLIVWLRAPVAPLVVGLTSTVAGIAAWGLSRIARKPVKEA